FNPANGQGMSVAALGAQVLTRELRQHGLTGPAQAHRPAAGHPGGTGHGGRDGRSGHGPHAGGPTWRGRPA
ncbi:hypothetical protein ABZ299_02340, partial [Streptomyces sp. NPDC006184]|uniref:hypothetical protein n=1 Tax=Streptomyces sp. NPDC006184 TaxID=3155455 RepID=UPI0033B8BBD7